MNPSSVSPFDVAAVVVPWLLFAFLLSLLLLFPAWGLREPLKQRAADLGREGSRLHSRLQQSPSLAFGRKLRAHRWSLPEVTTGLIFLIATVAALFSVMVAANVLGLRRPEMAESWLPWILGVALIMVMAEAMPSPGQPRAPLRLLTVGGAVVSVILVAVVKVEATNTPPAQYAAYHPLKDLLLGPLWVLLELTYFLGGAVLGRPGMEAGVRVIGWLLGLTLEAAVQVLAFVLGFAVLALRLALLFAAELITGSFLPAALVWAGLRRLSGTDIEGRPRLTDLPGNH